MLRILHDESPTQLNNAGHLRATHDLRRIFHLGLFGLAAAAPRSLDVAFSLTSRHYAPARTASSWPNELSSVTALHQTKIKQSIRLHYWQKALQSFTYWYYHYQYTAIVLQVSSLRSQDKHLHLEPAVNPSVLWRCWLGGRKGIRPVKNRVVECCCGCLSGAWCRLAYGPADATATHCHLLQQNPDWFYLSGSGSPGWSRKKGRKTGVC